jgi:hypothetical protein
MKRIILALAFCLLCLLVTDARSESVFSVEPVNQHVQPGTFNATLFLVSDTSVAGAQCDLSFNSSDIRVLNVYGGDVFAYWVADTVDNFTIINNTAGTVTNLVGFSDTAYPANGPFARLVFETVQEGVTHILPTDVIVSDATGTALPVLVFNGTVTVDGTPPLLEMVICPNSTQTLSHARFSWRATDALSPPELITYSHRLLGLHVNWSAWSTANETDYSYLSPGNYTFELRAHDAAGNIASLQHAFTIRDVRPPLIANITVRPPYQVIGGSVNISCDITDDFDVQEAKITILLPDDTTLIANLQNMHHTFFYNQTFFEAGTYSFNISARDVHGNKAVSATMYFTVYSEMLQYTLTVVVSPSAGGTVTLAPSGGVYDDGTIVTLTAMPSAGYTFDYWTGSLSGSERTRYLHMDEHKAVTAYFEWVGVPPAPPSQPLPPDGSENLSSNVSLSVLVTDPDGGTMSVEFYDAANDTPICIEGDFLSGTRAHTVWPQRLRGTTYAWYVIVDDGTFRTRSDTDFSFTTRYNRPPGQPILAEPAESPAKLSVDGSIIWTCSDPDGDAVTFDVYFGETDPSEVVLRNGTEPSYAPALTSGRSYHMRVVARDSYGAQNASEVWMFSVPQADAGKDEGGSNLSLTDFLLLLGIGVALLLASFLLLRRRKR